MALILDDLHHRFGRQATLEGVSLHVRSGDCYGFLGHNGAGKTTALRIALGLLRPRSGAVRVDGWSLARHPREVRARLGALVESPGFQPDWHGAANLVAMARLQGLEARQARAEARRMLEAVGLARVGSLPVRAYSLGMRQRLGIALALLGRPDYVLLDEPLNGLDPEGIAEMRALLLRLNREEGLTLLISSHQLHEVSDLCNRVGILRQGRLLVEEETRLLLAAGRRDYTLGLDDPESARPVLGELGVEIKAVEGNRFHVDLGALAPAQVAEALVRAGLGLETFAPGRPSLEQIYLRFTRGEGQASVLGLPEPESVRLPARAPSHPVLRICGYELRRLVQGWSFAALALAPALIGAGAVWFRERQARADAAELSGGSLASATEITAFEAVGVHLSSALPLLLVLLALLASQSLAGELSRGSLRNVAIRPVRRWQIGVGKILAQLLAGLALFLVAVGAAFLVAGFAFEFKDLVEILPGGQTFPLRAAAEIWPVLLATLPHMLVPLAAYVALGFLAGALVRSSVKAVSLALGGVMLLEFGRTVARSGRWEQLLPSAYLPSPLGDSSYLGYFMDMAQGASNAAFRYAETAFTVPLAWALLAFALAVLAFARRYVP